MNSKELIKGLDNSYMTRLFEKDIEPVKLKGFGIFFKGQMVKPAEGNVLSYPSVNAAIDALKRNSHAYWAIQDKLFLEKIGANWKTNKKAYSDYFYNPTNPDGTSGGYKNDKVWEEHKAIETAAHNAISHFIKAWLKSGELEIKQI